VYLTKEVVEIKAERGKKRDAEKKTKKMNRSKKMKIKLKQG